MATFLPAIHARMGDLDYFVSVLTLGEAARMVEYVENVDDWTPETLPELKLQRKLNLQRVEREMVPYLVSSRDHFYSSLTVEMRLSPNGGKPCSTNFSVKEQLPGGVEFGTLTLDGTEVLYALDGQHRLKSIELAIRQSPELAREHISLILVPFRCLARSQTLFSDLNRYAKTPSKSISLLFTHRESLARISKQLAHRVPLLLDRVNMESTSLSTKSRHFITLSTLYEMTRVLANNKSVNATNQEEANVAVLVGVWECLTSAMEQWESVAAGREHPAYLRQRYLNMHGVGQQAIALAVAQARRDCGSAWGRAVRRLRKIDWRLDNTAWQGVALHGGRVNNTATSIQLLAGVLAQRIGLKGKKRRLAG